jgi:large subunit ribosomal protein L16
MPLMPKRVKYRKAQRGRMKGEATRGSSLFYGDYGLQMTAPGWVTNTQIEAGRVAITHHLKTRGKLWIRIFPDKPVTKKPAETRMGKGKADVSHWVAVVLPGRIMYEIGGVPVDLAVEALRIASHKIPFKTKIIKRSVMQTEETGKR